MTCRWVFNSRLATFGRRVIIITAVFGLTTVGGTGQSVAASKPVGVSPAKEVVAVAPTAVSVTFAEPLRRSGARMRVLSPTGEVGVGEVSTTSKTLRRSLRFGAPGGAYTVKWTAITAKGQRLAGSFTFTAARSNTAAAPDSSPGARPVIGGTAAAGSSPTRTLSGAQAEPPPPDASRVETVPPAGRGGASSTQPPTTAPTAAPTSSWVPGAEAFGRSSLPGGALEGEAGATGGVPSGFTVVPLVVGALLVLAAGVVSLLNRARARN